MELSTGTLIVFLLSVCDVLYTTIIILGPVLFPEYDVDGHYYPYNRGNNVTCNVLGVVFWTFYNASYGYNACLALYHLLVIKYRCEESRFKCYCCRNLILQKPMAFFLRYNSWVVFCGLADI